LWLGTNTYVVGWQSPYILVDTGEGREEYIPILEEALRDSAKSPDPSDPIVSDIIITHLHKDHVGGLPSVLALLRRLWNETTSGPFKPPHLHKFPHQPSTLDTNIDSVVGTLSRDDYIPNPNGSPFHDLSDSQIIPPGELDGPQPTLQVLYTPGHTSDSICLYLHDEQALFTADTVLGHGTPVFEDLAAYMASLQKILEFAETDNSTHTKEVKHMQLYPGHGPVVANGPSLIKTYIKHRLEREEQIVQVLSTLPVVQSSDGGTDRWTTWKIVTVIYREYPESLWLAAAHSVELHLRKLEGEGKVKKVGGEDKDTEWEVGRQ
jgi:endoribonuclease LACTB2